MAEKIRAFGPASHELFQARHKLEFSPVSPETQQNFQELLTSNLASIPLGLNSQELKNLIASLPNLQENTLNLYPFKICHLDITNFLTTKTPQNPLLASEHFSNIIHTIVRTTNTCSKSHLHSQLLTRTGLAENLNFPPSIDVFVNQATRPISDRFRRLPEVYHSENIDFPRPTTNALLKNLNSMTNLSIITSSVLLFYEALNILPPELKSFPRIVTSLYIGSTLTLHIILLGKLHPRPTHSLGEQFHLFTAHQLPT